MESLIPHGHNEVTIPDSQGAGQMYGTGAPKGVDAREVPGVAFNLSCQLDRSGSAPVLLPRILSCGQVVVIEIMIATSSRKCRSYLRIRQAARQGGVATVPQIGNEVAAVLLDEQLHQRARVEVDERHGFSAAGR
jgi:hypothetical protein